MAAHPISAIEETRMPETIATALLSAWKAVDSSAVTSALQAADAVRERVDVSGGVALTGGLPACWPGLTSLFAWSVLWQGCCLKSWRTGWG